MIESRQNRWVKDIRRIRRSKDPRTLLEGPHLLAEAIAARLPLDCVLMTADCLASPVGSELAARLPSPPLEIDSKLLDSLCESDSPRGALALAPPLPDSLEDLPLEKGGVYVFADGLQDPGNLGALARVAEATGATALVTGPGSCRLNHPRALRASAGSLLRLPLASNVEPDALARRLADLDAVWATLWPRDGESIYRQSWAGTFVMVVGAEGPGISPRSASLTDLKLTIPMAGSVESLNATVSAAVVLFERARRAAGPEPE